jgi:hypothetical protein
MSYQRTQHGSDTLALEACAGLALGCAYSSSDDYEAELIQMRRKAGAYGSRHRRQAYVAFAVAAMAIIVAVFFAV